MTREIALHCMKAYSELHSELCELCPIYGQTGSDHCFEDALQYVIERLEQEPKTGHWILTDVEGYRVWHCNCSKCNKDPLDFVGGSENWWLIKTKLPKYCPNCSAKMVEPHESEA